MTGRKQLAVCMWRLCEIAEVAQCRMSGTGCWPGRFVHARGKFRGASYWRRDDRSSCSCSEVDHELGIGAGVGDQDGLSLTWTVALEVDIGGSPALADELWNVAIMVSKENKERDT
jgi:hypothetical protein